MSEYLQIPPEAWGDFQEHIKKRTRMRSIGITVLNSIEELAPEPHHTVDAAKERLLRPYAHQLLWYTCLDRLNLEELEVYKAEPAGKSLKAEAVGLIRMQLTRQDEGPLFHITWEEALRDSSQETSAKSNGLSMAEADLHSVTLNHRKATQHVKRYTYMYNPQEPHVKKVYGWQPHDHMKPRHQGGVPADKAFALAYALQNAEEA